MLNRSTNNIEENNQQKNDLFNEKNKHIINDYDKKIFWFDNGYVCFNERKNQFYYILEAPPIKNIVFSGGGARGILYSGVINAFEEFYSSECNKQKSFLSQIETVSGASIGSVFAAGMAIGMQSKELLKTLGVHDLQKLLGTGIGPIKRSGDPLFSLLKEIFPHIIIKRLNEIAKASQLNSFAELLSENNKPLHIDNHHLTNLRDELHKASPTITFAMLKTLHQLHPAIFKELYIAVVCKENGESCYFNAESTPDLEIALACRASVAVPIIIEPIKIQKKYIDIYRNNTTLPDILHFVDGGYLDNIPFSVVEEKQKKEHGLNQGEYNQNLQTLIILFDDSVASDTYDVETSLIKNNEIKNRNYIQSPFLNARSFTKHELAPKTALDFIYNIIPRTLGGIKSNVIYTLKREKSYEEVRHVYSQRNIPLQAGFTSGDFEKATKYAQQAIEKSKKLTLEYLTNHHGECIYQSYTEPNELIKNLPQREFNLLIENTNKIKCLNIFSLEKINEIRHHKNTPLPKDVEFEHFFQSLLNHCPNASSTNHLFQQIVKHFQIIKNDLNTSNREKMIRSLVVSLDYYPKLMQSTKNKNILLLFNKQFKIYMQTLTSSINTYNINFNETHLCVDKSIKNIFSQSHPFYIKFQRIIFTLHNTSSSVINPEDPFRRSFLETIINNLHDIASFHLKEDEKLKKMEDYLFESYYKLIFYQHRTNGALAQSLKTIIESSAGLNLSYKYGITLPRHINKLPSFIYLKKNNAQFSILEKKSQIKNIIFLKKFFALIEHQYVPYISSLSFFTILKKYFSPRICIDKVTLFDKIKIQSVVISLLSSPNHQDRQQASQLSKLIIYSHLDKNKIFYQTIFYSMSLLTHLSWIKLTHQEKPIYDIIITNLQHLVLNYSSENENKAQFIIILRNAHQALLKLTIQSGCYVFFKQSSELHQLIRLFITTKLHLPLNENEAFPTSRMLSAAEPKLSR